MELVRALRLLAMTYDLQQGLSLACALSILKSVRHCTCGGQLQMPH